MGTTTLTNMEYAKLITTQNQLEEMQEYLRKSAEFKNGTYGWESPTVMLPYWAIQYRTQAVLERINEMDEQDFRKLVEEDQKHYNPFSHSFTEYGYGYNREMLIDLSTHEVTRDRWKAMKAKLEQESQDESQEDESDGE